MFNKTYGLRKRDKYWSYDFQYNLVRYYGTTKCQRKADAQLFCEDLEEKIKDHIQSHAEEQALELSQLTLKRAINRFYNEKGQYSSDPKQKKKDLDRIKAHLGKHQHGENTLLTDITDSDLSAFIAYRRGLTWRDKHPSNRTVNLQTKDLVMELFAFASKNWNVKFTNAPTWKNHKLPEIKKPIGEISPSDEEKYFLHLREDYRPIVKFLSITGVRRMNVLLKWSEVDFETRSIRFVSKGGSAQSIPLTKEIEILLRSQLGNHPECVFTYVAVRTVKDSKRTKAVIRGKRYPITIAGLKTITDRVSVKSGVKATRHNWRHTFGSRITRVSDISRAQEILGHSSIETTKKFYAHVSQDDILDAMEKSTKWVQDSRKTTRKQALKDSKKA